MIRKLFLAVFALILLVAEESVASSWALDDAHSSIGFKVKHLMVANVHGEFKDFDVTVDYNEDDISKSKVQVNINVASIDTENEKRDTHLKSADFFDVANFPTMTFVSKRIMKSGDSYKMTGDLTIRGVTKEVTLNVDELTPPVKDPWGGTRMGASATGTINRTDFGLKWNVPLETGGLLVGEDVKMIIELELIKQEELTDKM
ncbi:protein yceI precursor [bacterium SM23_57]|nr:MAG: protein yceI precursor [bacterium SM23_57]